MGANRYDNGSVSVYTPQSMEELAFVPLMKRQKHDASQAKLEAYLSDINKIDPLDVHTPEAMKIKSDLTAKVNEQSEQLAKEGFNNNTIPSILRTNREIQDLFAPTGRAGQINAAKSLYEAEKTRFLEAASKQYGSDQAIKLWNQKVNDTNTGYFGYDDKNNITKIGNYGIVSNQNFQDDLKNFHSLLGSTMSEVARGGGKVYQDKDGNWITTNSNSSQMMKDNLEQLNNQYKYLDSKWRKKGGEGYNFNEEAGIDINNFNNRFNSAIYTQRERDTSKKENYSESINPANGKGDNDKNLNPSVITEDVNRKEEVRNDLKSFSDFSEGIIYKEPTPPRNLSTMEKKDQQEYYKKVADAKKRSKVNNSSDPKEMEERFKNNFSLKQQRKYMDTFNAKIAQGKIPKGTNPYIKKSQDVVKKDWEHRSTVEFSNQIIDVTAMDNDILASPNLIGKLDSEKSQFVQKRIANAIGNNQNLVFDNKTGQPIDMSKVDLTKVNLIGHYSPLNKLPNIGQNPDNSVSPYKIAWIDEDGKTKTAYMMRDASEMNKPVFKGARMIKKTTDKAVDNEGNYTSFNINNTPELRNVDLSPFGINERGLNGIRVKFDYKSNTYGLELIDKTNKSRKITNVSPEEYQNMMYDMFD